MHRVVLGALCAGLLAGCGASVGAPGTLHTQQFVSPYGVTPSVIGQGSVRAAVATQTVAQPVVVQEQAIVQRPVVSSTVVAEQVTVPRVVPTVTNVAQAVMVPRLAQVPVQQNVVYTQYCSPWVAQGTGIGGYGVGALGLGGDQPDAALGMVGAGAYGLDVTPEVEQLP